MLGCRQCTLDGGKRLPGTAGEGELAAAPGSTHTCITMLFAASCQHSHERYRTALSPAGGDLANVLLFHTSYVQPVDSGHTRAPGVQLAGS